MPISSTQNIWPTNWCALWFAYPWESMFPVCVYLLYGALLLGCLFGLLHFLLRQLLGLCQNRVESASLKYQEIDKNLMFWKTAPSWNSNTSYVRLLLGWVGGWMGWRCCCRASLIVGVGGWVGMWPPLSNRGERSWGTSTTCQQGHTKGLLQRQASYSKVGDVNQKLRTMFKSSQQGHTPKG